MAETAEKQSRTGQTAIEFSQVTMSYGDFTALSSVSFSVEKGEIFGFLGPNGAGKTTTIKLLAGLMEPDSGEVVINGFSLKAEPEKAKSLMGYIPDRPFVYDKLTGDEYVAFASGLWGIDREEAIKGVTEYLTRFSIEHMRTELIEGYSHGMKQKLVMSAAFVHKPQLLIVDEPTVGLDPASVLVMKGLFRELASSGGAVFLSTHSLSVAESLCDRIAILNHGRIIALGTMDELKEMISHDDGNLEEIFLSITSESDSGS